jgi:hypothetical protein
MVRLALDSMGLASAWETAFDRLRTAGIPKSRIRSYAIVGDREDPDEAWERCRWIERHKVRPLPMWFHPLDSLKHNVITHEQRMLGWNDYERRRLMQWFYKHKKAINREGELGSVK